MTRASDLIVERFRPEHFERIELQPAQAHVREYTTRARLERLAAGPSYSGMVDGRVIFCGGLVEFSAERGQLWSYVGAHAGAHFVRLHRYVSRFLQTVDRSEITATCVTGFVQGARWLDLLGFRYVRALGPWGPLRIPHDLYARVS